MSTFLTVIHVIVCLFLVTVVLLQSGRAGGMGVLSGGTSQTVFGGRGAGGFLTKATSVCAGIFILTSASLAYTSSSSRDSLSRGAHRPAGAPPAVRPAPTKNAPTTAPTPAAPASAPTPAPTPASADAAAPTPAAPAPTPAAPAPTPAAPAPAR